MNTAIYIENLPLDVNQQLSNQITYAIDDLQNIDSKSTAFSKTIIIPGTANNNTLFGNIFEFNNSNYANDTNDNVKYNFNAAKSAQCRIEQDGLLIIKGVLRLMEIVIDGEAIDYEVSVIGELGGFVSKLGAKKIEELDFSAYNSQFNEIGIVNSWDNAAGGSGLYFPLIDYGNYSDSTKHEWKIGTFRPALFVKEYIDKIFAAAGYTYECDLFNTTRFKSLIVPYNRKTLTSLNTTLLIRAGYSKPVQTDATTAVVRVQVVKNSTVISDTNYLTTGEFIIDVNNISFATNDTIKILIGPTLTGVPLDSVFGTIGAFSTSDDITFTYTPTQTVLTSIRVTLQLTDEIVQRNFTPSENILYDAQMDIISTTPVPTAISRLDDIKINDTIPINILQKDFFTSILKLFNLYVYEDKFIEKHLVIKPYVDFYAGVEDWSDKIDRGTPIKIKPMSELNSRYYQFKFKGDSDYYNELYKKRYNEGYGDRIYDSAFEFAKETATVEIIFSATPLVGYQGEEKVYSTIFKQTGNAPTQVEENVDSNIRILQAKKITGVTLWKIRDADNTVLDNRTDYGFAGHLNDPDVPSNDLFFGVPKELFFTLVSGDISVNQFNVYYSPYMAEITDKDSRLLTCNVKLTDTDVYNLDFAKYKFIDGGYWRLIKVYDFTPGKNDPVKCDFLRVIYTTY
jgi:hypothetical protein